MEKSRLLSNLTGITLGLILIFLTANYSNADVLPINPFNTNCNPDKKEIMCDTVLDNKTRELIYDECLRYKLDHNFTILTWRKSSENDKLIYTNKYCVSRNLPIGSSLLLFVRKIYLPAIFITVIIEGMVLVLFKLIQDKKSLMVFVSANLLSLLILSFMFLFSIYKFRSFLSGLITLGILELFVIIFEAVFFYMFYRKLSFKRIFVLFFVANILSVIFGSMLHFRIFQGLGWR